MYQFDPLGYNTSDPHVAVKGTKQKNDRSPKIVRSIVPSVYFASSFYCAFGILTQKILFDPAHPMSFFFFPVLLTLLSFLITYCVSLLCFSSLANNLTTFHPPYHLQTSSYYCSLSHAAHLAVAQAHACCQREVCSTMRWPQSRIVDC